MQTERRPGVSAVKSLRVITTGYAEQHDEHRHGSRLPTLWWVLRSKSWSKIPINAYLIEHQDGLVLFDTGLDPAIVADPDYISSPIGRFLLKKIFRFHIGEEDRLSRQLASIGVAAANISKAVISHLHFDHIGGIADIPQAQLLVSQAEWQQLYTSHPERKWILREHIELPDSRWRPIKFDPTDDPLLRHFGGAFDLMGDGSMILLPTPGHTPGSTSMLIRSDQMPPILLVGDLTYERESLMTGRVPGVGNHKQLKASFAKVRRLKSTLPNLIIVPSHDPRAVLSQQWAGRNTAARRHKKEKQCA